MNPTQRDLEPLLSHKRVNIIKPGESVNLVAKAGSYMIKHNDIAATDNFALGQQNRISMQKASSSQVKGNVLMQHSFGSNQRSQQRRKLLFEYGADKQKAPATSGSQNMTPPPNIVAGSRLHRNSV